MSGAPFETPSSFTNWGLVLDGDVRQDVVNRGGCSATQQLHLQRPPRQYPRAGSITSAATAATVRESISRNNYNTNHGSGTVLDDWERSAVGLYREIRRHRSEGSQPTRNGAKLRDGTHAKRRLDPSEYPSLPPYAALMGTAFPQLLGGPFAPPGLVPPNLACDSIEGAPQLSSSSPLLLEYFLSIGYPLRLSYNAEAAAASYSAALVAVAQKTVAWFNDSGVAVEDMAPSRIAAPAHRFGIRLLPDVLQQTVAAHRMTPATATAWLLRVYVGFLAPQEAKEHSIQAAIAADHGFESGPPDPGMPPAFCMEDIWRWASAMCAAVYQLQTNTRTVRETSFHRTEKLPSGTLSGSGGEKTVSQQATQSLASERRSDNVGWRLFALTVLQQTTTLILRGCFNTATVNPTTGSPDSSSAGTQGECAGRGGLKEDSMCEVPSSPLASEAILPPVPTTRVVVEGLACFAQLLRLHEKFPRHGKLRNDPGGVRACDAATHVAETAQEMVAKQWEGHAQLAVQQLPHLSPDYHHLVHMMDFVLTS
ncbi:hypothetical protein LPMP_292000 [Leishmania panamensis]|uniref:hypothetical protein n=1 Tax=Leishmania panamensis TaxID=5679 RepID=UPI0004F8D702|nr:hypothetical protein LPMP_292000 [Leishmania panamensis]AIO00147.1 hypothetical protein LPMP_292000 [Leishmania panamensis]